MAYTQDNFDWQGYLNDHPNLKQGNNVTKEAEGARAYQDYVNNGSTWLNATDKQAATQYQAPDGSITPQNVASAASSMVQDPSQMINADKGTSAAAATQNQTGTAAQISDAEKNASQVDTNNNPSVQAQQVDQAQKTDAHTYDATTTQDAVANNQMEAAQGQIKDQDLVKAEQEDMKGVATGVNEDGSINYLGQALNQYASQNLSTVIDTSTAEGKLLAAQLGDGNYIDSKATLQGQLALLQQQFVDADGNPKIPSWAAATSRNVSQIMAFSGMTGTAATAAMSQALLEASLPIAQADSQFYQTLTVKNLDNKQQSIINTANVLAKFEQSNLDNRQAAAVQNAQSFLAMDMKNLDNEQQAKAINNQSMIQSILADANAKNVAAQFNATSQNQVDQFYASLNAQIAQFNASQQLTADQFNANMEDSRQKYNATNAYNIAMANANWRQQVQMQDDQQAFEAATQDVKAATDLQTQQLNQIWDRSDSLLDYAFQSSENQKNRDATLALAQLQMKASTKNANMTALGSLAGSFVSSKSFDNIVSGIFG